jgi:hypothetical protein
MKLCPLFESIENQEVRADCHCNSCVGYFAGLETANLALPRESIEAAIVALTMTAKGACSDDEASFPLYHIEQLRAMLPKEGGE